MKDRELVMLLSMGLQRVGHDLVTEPQFQIQLLSLFLSLFSLCDLFPLSLYLSPPTFSFFLSSRGGCGGTISFLWQLLGAVLTGLGGSQGSSLVSQQEDSSD